MAEPRQSGLRAAFRERLEAVSEFVNLQDINAQAEILRRFEELGQRYKKNRDIASLASLAAALTSWREDEPARCFEAADAMILQRKQEAVKRINSEFRRHYKDFGQREGRKIVCISNQPPELKIGPFIFKPDFETACGHLYYAGCLIGESLSLELPYLFEYIDNKYRELEERGLKNGLPEGMNPDDPALNHLFSEEFFGDVFRAYKVCLKFSGGSLGTRLELSELFPMLALERQSKAFSLNEDKSGFVNYSRCQFCWDLARLRRCGGFLQHGLRLYLGTATIGATKNKDRVYLLDDGVGLGQYYLSLWFERQNKA